MKNLAGMMKQAQAMQQKMEQMQQEIAAMHIDGSAGAGLVKVTLNGEGRALAVHIDPSVIAEGDAEVVSDLVAAAFNDAQSKVEQEKQSKMQALTGGLNLPAGMKLPF